VTRRPRLDVPATMLPLSIKHSPAEHPGFVHRTGPSESGAHALSQIFVQSMDQPSRDRREFSVVWPLSPRDCSPSCIGRREKCLSEGRSDVSGGEGQKNSLRLNEYGAEPTRSTPVSS
jgi:hypothetical protein